MSYIDAGWITKDALCAGVPAGTRYLTGPEWEALGSQGGAVLGSAELVAHLVDTARTFIFDTGLAPVCAATSLSSKGLRRG